MARRWLAKNSFFIRAPFIPMLVRVCVRALDRWDHGYGHWIMPAVRCIQMCDSRTFARMQGIFYSCCYSYGTFNPFSVCLNLPSHKIPIEWNANIQKTEHMYPTSDARCATSLLCFHCFYYGMLLHAFRLSIGRGRVRGRLKSIAAAAVALCSPKNDFANKI